MENSIDKADISMAARERENIALVWQRCEKLALRCGTSPRMDWLGDIALKVDGCLSADEKLMTSASNVYSAGGPVHGRR
jgi:hypothetical protein